LINLRSVITGLRAVGPAGGSTAFFYIDGRLFSGKFLPDIHAFTAMI